MISYNTPNIEIKKWPDEKINTGNTTNEMSN